jgi:hypothetical protein
MASFADYVRDVMDVLPKVNGNPMLSATSTDDNARYRADPFYKSRAIQERDRLALEEEKLKKEEAIQSEPGMMGEDYGGDNSGGFGGEDGGGVGGFGIGMSIGGADAGIAGPGAGLGMTGDQGGLLGGLIGGLFGMPGMGSEIGKSLAYDAPTTVTPQSVVNAAIQNAAINAAKEARDAVQNGASPAAQAAANAVANEAAIAAAQNSGSAPTGLGGDLGTGAADAAGFGGYGGVW